MRGPARTFILLVVFMINACSTGRVSNGSLLQKRKYTKGFHWNSGSGQDNLSTKIDLNEPAQEYGAQVRDEPRDPSEETKGQPIDLQEETSKEYGSDEPMSEGVDSPVTYPSKGDSLRGLTTKQQDRWADATLGSILTSFTLGSLFVALDLYWIVEITWILFSGSLLLLILTFVLIGTSSHPIWHQTNRKLNWSRWLFLIPFIFALLAAAWYRGWAGFLVLGAIILFYVATSIVHFKKTVKLKPRQEHDSDGSSSSKGVDSILKFARICQFLITGLLLLCAIWFAFAPILELAIASIILFVLGHLNTVYLTHRLSKLKWKLTDDHRKSFFWTFMMLHLSWVTITVAALVIGVGVGPLILGLIAIITHVACAISLRKKGETMKI